MLAAQHHKLVAYHQDLDLLGLRGPEAERNSLGSGQGRDRPQIHRVGGTPRE